MEKQSRSLALYKVQANGWNEGEYAAADSQQAAIDNVAAAYQDLEPQTCSVIYLGGVWLPPQDVTLEQTVDKLREENERLKSRYEWTDNDYAIANHIIGFFKGNVPDDKDADFDLYASWLATIMEYEKGGNDSDD